MLVWWCVDFVDVVGWLCGGWCEVEVVLLVEVGQCQCVVVLLCVLCYVFICVDGVFEQVEYVCFQFECVFVCVGECVGVCYVGCYLVEVYGDEIVCQCVVVYCGFGWFYCVVEIGQYGCGMLYCGYAFCMYWCIQW